MTLWTGSARNISLSYSRKAVSPSSAKISQLPSLASLRFFDQYLQHPFEVLDLMLFNCCFPCSHIAGYVYRFHFLTSQSSFINCYYNERCYFVLIKNVLFLYYEEQNVTSFTYKYLFSPTALQSISRLSLQVPLHVT